MAGQPIVPMHIQVLVTTALSQFDVQSYVAEPARSAPIVASPPRPASPPAKTVDQRAYDEVPF